MGDRKRKIKEDVLTLASPPQLHTLPAVRCLPAGTLL